MVAMAASGMGIRWVAFLCGRFVVRRGWGWRCGGRWGWCSVGRGVLRTRGSGWPTPGGRGRSRGALGGVDAGGVVADEVAGFAAAAAAEGFGAAVRAGDGEGAGLAGLGGDGAADAGEEFLDGAGAELAVGGAGAR